jgi:site-specific DNA recombinase
MRVALYARVSSEQQEQRGTVASQLDALRAYAVEHHMEISEEYVCVDDGYSGARLDRPALDRLRDGARLSAFEAVLVLCPDRLARKYAYQILIIEELERFGVSVQFLDNPLPTDPNAQLLVQMQGIIAEYERTKIAERNRRGRLFRLRQGEALFWRVPYGYRRIPRQGTIPPSIEIDEATAVWVREIFRWHVDEQLSTRVIAQRLAQQGIPSPIGKTQWSIATVHRLLHNEAYIGNLAYNRREKGLPPIRRGWGKEPRTHARVRPREEWIILSIPPLIDAAMLARSLEIHGDNSRFSPRRLREERWLLRRLVRCGVCGRAMACQELRAVNGTAHQYYSCQRRGLLPDDERCTQRRVRAEALDQLIWAEVRRHLEDPATLTRAYRQAGVDGERVDEDALSVRFRHLERRQRDLDKEETRLLDVYQAGLVDLAQLTRRHNVLQEKRHRLEQEQRVLTSQLATAGNQRTIADGLETFSRHVHARLRGLTFHEKQALVRLVVDKVTVRDYHVAIYFKIPIDTSPPPPSPSQPGPVVSVSTQLALRSTH